MRAAEKKRPAAILQGELAEFRAVQSTVARYRRDLDEAEAWLKSKEAELLARLAAGAEVQNGRYGLGVEQQTVCNPSYKDALTKHFEDEHGVPAPTVVEAVQSVYRHTVERAIVTERPAPKAVR